MTLGGYDERLHASKMVHVTVSSSRGFYAISLRKVYLRQGGESAAYDKSMKTIQLDVPESMLNRGNVIVDSGTTDTYFTSEMAKAFGQVWKQFTGTDYSHSSLKLTEEQLQAFPTILFQMQGDVELNQALADANDGPVVGLAGELDPEYPYDVILAMPASHYFEYDESKDKYTPRFYVDEGGGSVMVRFCLRKLLRVLREQCE
jgi:hypothetical protein